MERENVFDRMDNLCLESTVSLATRMDSLKLGHGSRIQENSRLFLNFFPQRTRDWDAGKLFLFCIFHDVGELVEGLDHSHICEHCEAGEGLAELHPDLKDISELILFHHEHWDGSGCYGLKGREIPEYSRLLGILNAFDLMVYSGPTHFLMSKEKAVKKIKEGSGIEFDPSLVPLVVDILTTKGNFSFCRS